LIVYRLTRSAFANDLSGAGGLNAAGRCNHKGTRVIYTARHVSLALAEVLVHLELSEVPLDYVLVTIEISETVPFRECTAKAALAASKKPDVPVLVVPSVVVPQESNVVMFPDAAGFEAKIVNVEPFQIDERLLGWRKKR